MNRTRPVRNCETLHQDTVEALRLYGEALLLSSGMQSEKGFIQHGRISCFDHSIRVAYIAVWLTLRFRIPVDLRSLVRGALLHDYFLYDWHEPDPSHRRHGFIHARRSLENARRDFVLNKVERDIIVKHMFPMNLCPPRYRESTLVTIADKLAALAETVTERIPVARLRLKAIRV